MNGLENKQDAKQKKVTVCYDLFFESKIK